MLGVEHNSDDCREALERQERGYQQLWTLRLGTQEDWGQYVHACAVLRGRPSASLRFPPVAAVATDSQLLRLAAGRMAVRVICPLPEGTCVTCSKPGGTYPITKQPMHCIVRSPIDDSLRRACPTSLDLSLLDSTTTVCPSFLEDLKSLVAIDLSPLSHVTIIEDSFLKCCSGLASIDLSPLGQVTAVGDAFLHGCCGLSSIDLSPLGQMTAVGDSFLRGCSGLTSIDLSPLGRVTAVGDFFLNGCSGLTSIDLSPLRQEITVGYYFIDCCFGLDPSSRAAVAAFTARRRRRNDV